MDVPPYSLYCNIFESGIELSVKKERKKQQTK